MDLIRVLRDQRQRALMALAQQGHETAFRRLYRELYGPVRGYVLRRIAGSDEADDVTSIIFEKFLRGLQGYETSRGSVWTWTMTLARNAVIDHLRTAKATESLDEIAQTVAASMVDPLTALIDDEEATLAHGLLKDYPAQTREMFALRYGQGLRIPEIARVMGLTEAAVKQRFSRTLRELRSGLEDRVQRSEVSYATPEAE